MAVIQVIGEVEMVRIAVPGQLWEKKVFETPCQWKKKKTQNWVW
jgi:hypothetical protein